MTALVVFVIVGVATYLSRSVFIVAVGDRRLPEGVERALRFVGPATLAALVASYLTAGRGLTGFARDLPALAATIVGVVAARWRRSFAIAFVAAIAVYYALSALT